MAAKITDKEFDKRLRLASNKTLIRIGNYKNTHTKVLLRCLVCSNEWDANPSPVLHRGVGCPQCGRIKGDLGRRLTLQEHQEKLDNKFGKGSMIVIEAFINQEIKVKCCKGHMWVTKLTNLSKTSKGCPTCYVPKVKYTEDYVEKQLTKKFGSRFNLNGKLYNGPAWKAKFKCQEGHTFIKGVQYILNNKDFKCPCCRKEKERRLYEKLLIVKARKEGFELLEPYKNAITRHNYRCLTCNSIRTTKVDSLFTYGCAACEHDKNKGLNYKIVTIGNKVYNLQGYEPQALQILYKEGIKPEYIKVRVAEGKPTIKYQHKNKERLYVPDFYITSIKCIVEVKSDYTFGITEYNKDYFYSNKEKAKACLANGYNFRMMLLDEEENLIRLPIHWYDLSRREVIRYIS